MNIEELAGKDRVDLAGLVAIIEKLGKKIDLIEQILQKEKESRIEEQKRMDKTVTEHDLGIKNLSGKLANLKEKEVAKLSKEVEEAKKAMLIIKKRIEKLEEEREKLDGISTKNKTRIEELSKSFTKFIEELDIEKKKVLEKDELIEQLEKKREQQKALIKEKNERLEKLEAELSETKEKIGSMRVEKKKLAEELEALQVENQTLKEENEKILKEFEEFKEKIEPSLVQNSHVRKLLSGTVQGQIYLILVEAYPKSLVIDEVARQLDVAVVKIKAEILGMQELGILEFNTITREVRLKSEVKFEEKNVS
ncbi:MAG: hypothetical protein ACTSQE_11075 [Candidatus Heimdallarchaeaceae archaeon]